MGGVLLMASTLTDWIPLGRESEFVSGVERRATSAGLVLVMRLEGQFYAFDPTCPHGGGDLRRCEPEGSTISCPLHGWTFDLSKRGYETHGFRGLRTYATRLCEGVLFVNLDPTVNEVATSSLD
jgi:nitrite reductase/ring-hydroxylating ferredoxin subunit